MPPILDGVTANPLSEHGHCEFGHLYYGNFCRAAQNCKKHVSTSVDPFAISCLPKISLGALVTFDNGATNLINSDLSGDYIEVRDSPMNAPTTAMIVVGATIKLPTSKTKML